MINERIPLSIGLSGAARAFVAVFGLVFAGMGGLFVLGPATVGHYFGEWFGDAGTGSDFPDGLGFDRVHGFDDPDGDLPMLPFRLVGLIGLCGVPFVLIGLYISLRALRRAGWLEGTVVQVRGALRTATVDLATADVTAGAVTYRRGSDRHERVERVPTIEARDRRTGRRVTVPLRGEGSAQLPPYQLRALADAMTAGRATTGADADVHNLARQLRTLAENPLGL